MWWLVIGDWFYVEWTLVNSPPGKEQRSQMKQISPSRSTTHSSVISVPAFTAPDEKIAGGRRERKEKE